MKLNYSILAILIVAFGCKKEPLQIIGEPIPVFYIDYSVAGAINTIKAGESNYYMQTSSTVDSFAVSNYVGKLAMHTEDKSAFEFKFRGNSINDNNTDSVFFQGPKELLDSNIASASNSRVKIKLEAKAEANVLDYKWMINGTISSSERVAEMDFDYLQLNNFPASLVTVFDTGCSANSARCIDINNSGCYADFFVTNDGGNNYTFQVSPDFINDVSHVIWYVGSSQISTGKTFSYNFSSNGKYYIWADVFFKSGCMSCLGKQITVSPSYPGSGCFADFKVNYIPYSSQEFIQLNRLEINYWNEQGQYYSTKFHNNPGSAEILESSNYKLNEFGNPTQKVKLKGIVKLANELGEEIEITISEAFIAVGKRS